MGVFIFLGFLWRILNKGPILYYPYTWHFLTIPKLWHEISTLSLGLACFVIWVLASSF